MPRGNNLEKDWVIILIPSHNEIDTLKKICQDIKKLHLKAIVIDDGSKDGTSYWLKKNQFNYIKNKKKIGYEKSLILGINYIIKKFKAKYLITFDADGEHRTKDLIKIINKLKKKDIDMIVGNRNKYNRLSEYILSFLFFVKFGIKDPLSGFKVYSLQKLKLLKNKIKNNSYLIDIILHFKKNKFVLKNIPIKVNKRLNIPRAGSGLLINLKILSLARFILFN
jgi:glycosyltransferase involved in cell wall biosynthesis